MADTQVTAPPFFWKHPLIKIGTTGSSVELECGASNLTIDCDQDEKTVDLFCGSYTNYGAAKWTITITVALSFGTNGLWTLVHPLCGTVQPFIIQPATGTPSIDNPVMSGTAAVKQLPFADAAPNEASEVDLELAVQGDPVFGIVAPTLEEVAGVAASAAA